jgi:7-carboxy-7-deazaguanine synthase
MNVIEIFESLQGETTHAGRPCAFVRFAGCDLRCRYCDTTYAFSGGKPMGPQEIKQALGLVGVSKAQEAGPASELDQPDRTNQAKQKPSS